MCLLLYSSFSPEVSHRSSLTVKSNGDNAIRQMAEEQCHLMSCQKMQSAVRQEKCIQRNSRHGPQPHCPGKSWQGPLISSLMRYTWLPPHTVTHIVHQFSPSLSLSLSLSLSHSLLYVQRKSAKKDPVDGHECHWQPVPRGDGFTNCWFLLAIVHSICQYLWHRKTER